MQQRRGVDELDRCGERDMAVAAVAAQPRASEGQHRAQPLAAGRDDVAGELRDQRHRAVHPIDNELVHPAEIVAEQPKQRIERRAGQVGDRQVGGRIGTRHRRHRVLLRLRSAIMAGRRA